MRFNFFTSGGKRFWEDLFIYQNWRIQRHYLYKEYRLLDSSDIKRESGSFEKCHRSFLEYAKAYEMGKQQDHIVILLHGLREDKNLFGTMIYKMKNENYMTMAVNYPSTKKDLDSHVRQLNVLMNNLSDANHVSFIAKGVSGLIIRKLLSSKSDWKKRIKVKRILQINPPNKGSRFFTKLSEYKILRWIYGPMISELKPDTINLPLFNKGAELGIIHCDYPLKNLSTYLPKKIRAFLPSQVEGDIDCPNKTIYINNTRCNPLSNDRIANACIRFLKDGLF